MVSKADKANPVLSILITNWNGWPDLQKCLESIRLSTFRDFEVLVTDNASTDGSVNNLRTHFPEVKVHMNQENIGAAPAFNHACQIVRGRYILLLDADTELAPDCIDKLMAFMVQREDISLVAPRTFNTDGSVQESARNFPTCMSGLFGRQSILTRMFPRNPFSVRYLQRDKLHTDEPFRVQQISAACMLFRRSLIEEVGPWDEGYPQGRDDWVDTDWCMRFKKKDKKIYCLPTAAVVHHDNNLRGKRKTLRRIWNFHWGAYRLYRINYTLGRCDPRAIMAFMALSLRAFVLMIENCFLPVDNRRSSNQRSN